MYKCGLISMGKGNIFIFSNNEKGICGRLFDGLKLCVSWIGSYSPEVVFDINEMNIGEVYTKSGVKVVITSNSDYIQKLGMLFSAYGVYYSLELNKMNIPELEEYSLHGILNKDDRLVEADIFNYRPNTIGAMEMLLKLKEIEYEDIFLHINITGPSKYMYDNIPKELILSNFKVIREDDKIILFKNIHHRHYENLIKTLKIFANNLAILDMDINIKMDNITLKGESGYKMLEECIRYSSGAKIKIK